VPAAVRTRYDADAHTLAFAGAVYSLDGRTRVLAALPPRACPDADAARALGYGPRSAYAGAWLTWDDRVEVAEQLLAQGARELLAVLRSPPVQ
jgi:hypothetical protein